MSWEPEMAAQTLQKRWKNDAIKCLEAHFIQEYRPIYNKAIPG
jgi:hypothetical protein